MSKYKLDKSAQVVENSNYIMTQEEVCERLNDLQSQLAEKEKEITYWKEKTKNRILNMKTTEFIKMCLNCGVMIEANNAENQKAIEELEKLKLSILDFSNGYWHYFNKTGDAYITSDDLESCLKEFIDNLINELKGKVKYD